MNSDRRKQIDEVIKTLNVAKSSLTQMAGDEGFLTQLAKARDALDGLPLEDIKNDEQEAFDSLSDGLQQEEKGQVMEEAISFLDSAGSEVQEVFENLEALEGLFEELNGKLEEAISALQSAKGE